MFQFNYVINWIVQAPSFHSLNLGFCRCLYDILELAVGGEGFLSNNWTSSNDMIDYKMR